MAGKTWRIIGACVAAIFLAGVGLWLREVVKEGKVASGRTSCLSSMDDLGGAITMYAADHDDTFTLGSTGTLLGEPHPTGLGWAGRIAPYFGKPAEESLHRFRDPVDGRGAVMSYGLNANVAGVTTTEAVAAPDRAILLFEVEGARLGGLPEFGSTERVSPVGDGTERGLRDCLDLEIRPYVRYATLNPPSESRHGGVLNLLCMDGHVAATRPGPSSTGANARNAKDAETATGCARPDLPGVSLPCAEGSLSRKRPLTFSLR